MKRKNEITGIFVDIGGVLLTNGWDSPERKEAAKIFSLDFDEMESRHRLTFDTFEIGKISLDDYLKRIIFYQKRSFNLDDFKKYMFERSKPYLEMIELILKIKTKYKLKVVAVSNEGKELNEFRVQKFKLYTIIDYFITSSAVHLRKPDKDIYRIAIATSQLPPHQILYIEDRLLFVQVAEELGIHGLHHTSYRSTREKLSEFGFNND